MTADAKGHPLMLEGEEAVAAELWDMVDRVPLVEVSLILKL